MIDVARMRAQGYCRTSNKHLIVSRIDRADWLQIINKHLGRPLDDFERWYGDYYRRVLGRDRVHIESVELFRRFPASAEGPNHFAEINNKRNHLRLVKG